MRRKRLNQMLKPNRTRKSNAPRITADLTSSQLVVAICVALCAALICFSLGVVVGKFDERNRHGEQRMALKPAATPPTGAAATRAAAKAPVLPAPPEPGKKTAATAVSGQGSQTSPRTVVVPASPPTPGFPSPAPKAAAENKPHPTNEHPAPKADTAHTLKPEKETPPTDSEKPPAQNLKPVEKTETEPPALEPVVKTAAAQSQKAIYTVQLAALSSSTREQQALRLKKELESKGMQPELLVTKGGARICVVVGSYPDRKTAQDACNELRKNKEFSDCFVRTR